MVDVPLSCQFSGGSRNDSCGISFDMLKKMFFAQIVCEDIYEPNRSKYQMVFFKD